MKVLSLEMGDNRDGNTRPIGIHSQGSSALQWFDLGTFGGERTDVWVMCMEVASNGMIVGHAPTQEGNVHAFAWTTQSGLVDVGTLEGHTQSAAFGVNKSGSLIVGWSGVTLWGDDAAPVVSVVWTREGPGPMWKVQKLDTQGFEQVTGWTAWTVNNNGQIVGSGWDNLAQVQVAFLWQPIPGENGWKVMKLETTPDYPNALAQNINEAGEIVGHAVTPDWTTALPALWKPAARNGSTWTLTFAANIVGRGTGVESRLWHQ
jgi:probable HAF family extracellular repeat protein